MSERRARASQTAHAVEAACHNTHSSSRRCASVAAAGRIPPSTSFATPSLAFFIGLAPSARLLSLAKRHLAFSTPLQRYLTYATFPVFVLHLLILTIVAFYLLKVTLQWCVQLLLIIAVTMLVAFTVFDRVIRRTPVTRFLGVKGHGPQRSMPAKPFQLVRAHLSRRSN